MRLLYLLYDHPFTGHSGVSMYCRDIIPGLVNRGMNVGVICVNDRDWQFHPYVQQSTERGVALFRFSLTSFTFRRSTVSPARLSALPRNSVSRPSFRSTISGRFAHRCS